MFLCEEVDGMYQSPLLVLNHSKNRSRCAKSIARAPVNAKTDGQVKLLIPSRSVLLLTLSW